MTDKKLNIFDVLKHANNKNYNYLNTLSDEEVKSIAPLIIMRWMSGTDDARQIVFLNEFMNPYVFNLHQERDLLWKLACACASGDQKRYKWIKTKTDTSFKTTIELVRTHYKYTERQARDSLKFLPLDFILDLADKYGYEKQDIAKIKKEFKNV